MGSFFNKLVILKFCANRLSPTRNWPNPLGCHLTLGTTVVFKKMTCPLFITLEQQMTKSIRTNDDDGKNKNILGQEKKQIGE
jgi:hypothetical protein